MDLILWRHAEAARAARGDIATTWSASSRPRARSRPQRMADWLNRFLPDSTRVLVSPALRSQQTAQALGRKFRTVRRAGARAARVGSAADAARWPDAPRAGADRRPPADAGPGGGLR